MNEQRISALMWEYQPHFADNIGDVAAAALAALGLGRVATRALVVGVRAPNVKKGQPVCTDAETGIADLDRWAALPDRVEEIYRNHPNHNLMFGDEPSMRDKPEDMRRGSVTRAVREIVSSRASEKGFSAFVGCSVRVGDYYVVPVVEIETSALAGDFVLSAKISYGQMEAVSSLAIAVVGQVLAEATAELERKDPGRYILPRGFNVAELVRRAGDHFMQAPAMAIREPQGTSGLLTRMDQLSALLYERKQGKGTLVFARDDDPGIAFDLRFFSPIPLSDARWSRKMLEMANADMAIVSDTVNLLGLGRRVPVSSVTAPTFDVEFIGQHRWIMKETGRPVIRCDFGVTTIPRRKITTAQFMENYRRVFVESSPMDASNASALFDAAERLGHGCMVLFASDAEVEAQRLAGQGTPTTPVMLTSELLERVSGIDGTILLDPTTVCHAVGVILDGPAHEYCVPARGSRYNSAVRYIAAQDLRRLAIVVSDDGMIDVLPWLRPRISRRKVRVMVEEFEHSTIENFHRSRVWLFEHAFYLDSGLCQRVNDSMARLAAISVELGRFGCPPGTIEPSLELNDDYFIEDDSVAAPESYNIERQQ